ncbi:hypothetical protein ACO0LO_15530 [Undibacterium sp. TJN25]|uniref:hypothetical protein n=1 Tax=Undibacterium sp. TJN25 TaxID=3413056 RepID=UPI003BF1B068
MENLVAAVFDVNPLGHSIFALRRKWIRKERCLSEASFVPFPFFVMRKMGWRLSPSPEGQVCGRLLFAYFILAKQNKVSSCRATPGQQFQHATELTQ